MIIDNPLLYQSRSSRLTTLTCIGTNYWKYFLEYQYYKVAIYEKL